MKFLSFQGNYFSSKEAHEFGELLNKVANVEDLDLSHNLFSEISIETFHHMGEMRRLNLSSNAISSVDWMFLTFLPKLEVLDLSNNNITTSVGMRHILSKAKNLKSLNLEGNPFHCVCIEMSELNDITKQNLLMEPHLGAFYSMSHSVTCASPANVTGLRVDEFFSSYCVPQSTK